MRQQEQNQQQNNNLLLITTLVLVVSSGNTSGTTTSEGRVLGELDVLLRIHVNHEGGGVHDLATDANVSLSDQDASVVDRLGKTKLEHLGLKSAVHQLGGAQLQNVVQLLLLLGDQSQTSHAADDGSSLENSAGVLLIEGEEFTSSLIVNPNTLLLPYGSWQERVELSRFHACSEDRIHRKYGVLGPNVHVRKDDGEYRR